MIAPGHTFRRDWLISKFNSNEGVRSVSRAALKNPAMRNSGSLIAERNSHLRMKAKCFIHSQIGGALCGLFA